MTRLSSENLLSIPSPESKRDVNSFIAIIRDLGIPSIILLISLTPGLLLITMKALLPDDNANIVPRGNSHTITAMAMSSR